MPSEKKDYGSIEEGEKTFDTTQMQYLGEGKPLSREEKLRKLLRVAVPLLAAIVIIGSAALFLFKDFGNLYPGRGGHGGTDPLAATYGSSPSKTTTTTTTSSHLPTSRVDSKCSAHDACSGLDGNCCPTNDGFFLDCCH